MINTLNPWIAGVQDRRDGAISMILSTAAQSLRHKVRHKFVLLAVGVLLLSAFTGWAVPAKAAENAPVEVTVKNLQQQGWTVTKSSSRNETLPGLPPYEELPRVVSVTTYILERGGKTITCEIAYDSQRDTLDEHCLDEGS